MLLFQKKRFPGLFFFEKKNRKTFSRIALYRAKIARYGVLALAACAFLFILCCASRSVGPYDEGLILFGAERVGTGDLPHRDFYANYGPAQFYVLALLFKLFGPSVLIERLWDALTKAASVILVYLIAAKAGARWPGLLAAIASMVWIAAAGSPGYPLYPSLALVLASVFCLQSPRPGPPAWLAGGVAGLCLGLAALFRYDVGLAAGAAMGVLLTGRALLRGRPGARLSASEAALPAAFVAGMSLVLLPAAAAYIILGMGPGFVFDVIVFPAANYAKMRSLPLPLPFSRPADLDSSGVYLPVLVGAAAACMIAVPACRRRWLTLLLAAVTFVFVLKGYVRISVIHMSAAIVTALCLLAVIFAPLYRKNIALRALACAVVMLVALGTRVALTDDFWAARWTLSWLAEGAPCPDAAAVPALGCFRVDADHLAALRYIRLHTTPADRLFVGLGRHDKIFVDDVAFYFLAGRASATRWHHMDPGLQTSEPIQREIMAELRRNCPPYVVLESQWDDMKEPNGSAVSSGVTVLDQDIRANFDPVAAFGPITILARSAPCTAGAR